MFKGDDDEARVVEAVCLRNMVKCVGHESMKGLSNVIMITEEIRLLMATHKDSRTARARLEFRQCAKSHPWGSFDGRWFVSVVCGVRGAEYGVWCKEYTVE